MVTCIYDLPAETLAEYQAKEEILRQQHQLEMLFQECNECFERFEVRGEDRDGYVCPLNDIVYCLCNPDDDDAVGTGIDAEYWDCPVYLEAVKELKASFGVFDDVEAE